VAGGGACAAARTDAAHRSALPTVADDPQFQAWVGAFLQELALLGWSISRNVRIDTRWATMPPKSVGTPPN
jgi:hypothetical protein